VAQELEILGPASSWLSERAHAFCDALVGSAWGDVPPARLVIAEDYVKALRRYLPPARFEAWAQRQGARGTKVIGVGMGFVATDGKPTAVVAALPEVTARADLLALCCHELCELSIDAPNSLDQNTVRAAMSTMIWSEHVVERRRAQVFKSQGWPRGWIDDSQLTQLWRDYESDLPELIRWAVEHNDVPGQLWGEWQILVREVVCAYGRAQGGDSTEEREIEAFLDLQSASVSNSWLELMTVCDDAFGSPELDHTTLDSRGEEGWLAVTNALGQEWNELYLEAEG
jgi:hypothetical protein